jgi:hypothetical protein
MAINIQLLTDRFKKFTGCDEAKANNLTMKYLKACAKQALMDNFSSDAGSGYYINATVIDASLGSIICDKKRYYVWSTFQQFKERVFDIISSGDNLRGKLTMATSQYSLEDIIMASGTCEELWHHVYGPLLTSNAVEGVDYDLVPVDLKSLGNYIKHNLSKQDSGVSLSYSEALRRNLKHAQKIYMLAEAGDGLLMQVIKNSVFGRKYYIGPNLQNVPKEVRHAALGKCVEYDIQCSVFAWKLDAYHDCARVRGERVSASYTLEYIDSKTAMRKRLAKVVFGTDDDWAVNIIKEFITAIGFGARKNAVGYVEDGVYHRTALNEIITSREKLETALNDPWVDNFINEQAVMNKYILETDGIGEALKQVPELVDRRGALKSNAAIAYLYQQSERRVLNDMLTVCDGREVLLTVHDCFYVRLKLGNERWAQLREVLQKHGQYYKPGVTEHLPWATALTPIDKSDPTYDSREQIDWSRRFRRSSGEGFYQPSDEEIEQMEMMDRDIMIADILKYREYAN